MSGPLALPAFANSQVQWGVTWPIGVAHPTITASSFGPSFPDHYRVYRSLTRLFSGATDISGSLPGAGYGVGVPFTDTGVSIGGTGHVYWMVGFDAGETHATYANSQAAPQFPLITPPAGVMVCHNHVVATGLEITGPAPDGNPPAIANFPFTTMPMVGAAIGRIAASVTITFGTFVPGTPYRPDIALSNGGFTWFNGWDTLPSTLGICDPGGESYSSTLDSSLAFGTPPTAFPSLQMVGAPGISDQTFQWGTSGTPAHSLNTTLDGEIVYIESADIYNPPSSVKMFTQGHIFPTQPPPPPPPPPPVPAWVVALGALAGGVNPYVAADFANGRYWDQINGTTAISTQWVQNTSWGQWFPADNVPGQGLPNWVSFNDVSPVLESVLFSGLTMPITTLVRTTGTGVKTPWYAGVADLPNFNSMIFSVETPTGNNVGQSPPGNDLGGGNAYGLGGATQHATGNGHNVAMLMNASYSGKASIDGGGTISMSAPVGGLTAASVFGLTTFGAGSGPADLWLGLVAIWQGDQSAHLPAISA